MATRSITDNEISLIKGMLKIGMKNSEIQFYFNRPDRRVNSGRISGIKKGHYGPCAKLPAATEKDIIDFKELFEKNLKKGNSNALMPLDLDTLKAMFEHRGKGEYWFTVGEGTRHECKEDFSFKHSSKWMKPIAALSNHIGGYVIFGVKDKYIVEDSIAAESYKVTGLKCNDFENADPADFTKKLKSVFDPTPNIETIIISLGSKKVGIVYVHQHSSRPIIAQKNEGEQIKEGDIFFRYLGQSSRIKYSDLRGILDDRDKQSRIDVLPLVERVLNLGPDNAMVADLTTGHLSDIKKTISIDSDLLEKIKFIRQSDFNESEGVSSLNLVGDVQTITGQGQIVQKGFVTPTDLIKDFLCNESPYSPTDYIRCAVETGAGGLFPMHYYARRAGMNLSELVGVIEATNAPNGRKELYKKRVSDPASAFHPSGGKALPHINAINAAQCPKHPENLRQAIDIAKAVSGLKQKPDIDLDEMLNLLQVCWDIVERERRSWITTIRKAVMRLDQLYFYVT